MKNWIGEYGAIVSIAIENGKYFNQLAIRIIRKRQT